MVRKAIIIGNNTGKGAPNYLGGVNHDLINYQAYLKSRAGGEWYQTIQFSEIDVAYNLNRNEILQKIRNCNADYSFVVFTGHGFVNSKDGLTYVCVNDNYISEDELMTSCYKRTLILDCCREKTTMSEGYSGLSGVQNKATISELNKLASQGFSVVDSRKKFDKALSESSYGAFTGYSCLIDQFSGDNPSSGGLFSTELMKTGYRFALRPNLYSEVLPIKNAVDQVVTTFKSNPLTKEQTPTFKTSIQLTAPFAITNLG